MKNIVDNNNETISLISAYDAMYDKADFKGKSVIGTGYRLDKSTLPDNMYLYELQCDLPHDENLRDEDIEVVSGDITKNFYSSIISIEPLDFDGKAKMSLSGIIVHEDEPFVTLESYIAEQGMVQELNFDM